MSDTAAKKLKDRAVASRVKITWWGTTRACDAEYKKVVAENFAANHKMLSLSKSLIDTRNKYYSALTEVRNALRKYWYEETVPYVEKGVRLLNQSDFDAFKVTMQGYKQDLHWKRETFADHWNEIIAEAKQRLGQLFKGIEYPGPNEIGSYFDVDWDFPEVNPPSYLMNLDPAEYERQCAIVAAKFETAAAMAHKGMAAEFQDLLTGLHDRLLPNADGSKKIFRDSTVRDNFMDFFTKFQKLKIKDGDDLDKLVQEATTLIGGLDASDLRSNDDMRNQVATQIKNISQAITDAIGVEPRRKIVKKQKPVVAAEDTCCKEVENPLPIGEELVASQS